MLDWHSCQICYPLEIKILLLYLWWNNGAVKRLLSRPPTYFDARERDYIVFQRGLIGGLFFSVSSVSFQALFISLHLLIITLIQEANWHECQSNILSSDTKIYMRLLITKQWKLFIVRTDQVRSPYIEHVASGLTNPTHLEGEVRFDQAQDQQVVTTRSPRIVTECLLTRSMLFKIYVYSIYSRFRIGTILSIRKHGYEFITTLSYRVWLVLGLSVANCASMNIICYQLMPRAAKG